MFYVYICNRPTSTDSSDQAGPGWRAASAPRRAPFVCTVPAYGTFVRGGLRAFRRILVR